MSLLISVFAFVQQASKQAFVFPLGKAAKSMEQETRINDTKKPMLVK
jgi:hypothetical protein